MGIIIDEYINYDVTAKIISESAGRALGQVKKSERHGIPYFKKMYLTGVTSVAEYAADIWGFKDISACTNAQNRAMRYYMGVHRLAPIPGMRGDFGWSCTKYRRHQLILRLWNRLIRMDANRLTKHILIMIITTAAGTGVQR